MIKIISIVLVFTACATRPSPEIKPIDSDTSKQIKVKPSVPELRRYYRERF